MRLERSAKEPPEDGIGIRLVAAAAVEVALAAVVAQRVLGAGVAIAGLVLAPAGYWFSYTRRHRGKLLTKLLLSVGMVGVLAQFLRAVGGVTTVDAARVPLASLFVWVQVLHSFDVPRRRDLAFSVVSSLILMAEAGALSLDTSLLWFLVPWAALAGGWLYLSSRAPSIELAPALVTRPGPTARRYLGPARSAVSAGLAVVLVSAGLFLVMPRLPATLVANPPFSLRRVSAVAGFSGQVSNQGLPEHRGTGPVDFAPNAYPGFGDGMDLRSRGRLSDRVVFRVRSPQASLWRTQAYDTFDGTTWSASDTSTDPLPLGPDGQSFVVPREPGVTGSWVVQTRRIVQTFTIASPQPNALFMAPWATEVYFPSGGLRVDGFGSVRAPILLDQGLVYSVVSDVPVIPNEVLASVPAIRRAALRSLSADLQLPGNLPMRDGGLARRIAAGATTEEQRVLAVQTWLRRNTAYDLGIARDPAGVDAVDYFLFVRRRGFCEHIASAMTVLLREVGVPARIVVGFGPGERNPFTGYWEVRESDAHAWVEVWYPHVGWVPYDPTFGVPPAAPSFGSRFVLADAVAAVARFVRGRVPARIARLAATGWRVAARVLSRGWILAAPTMALGLGAVFAARRRRVRRRRRRAAPTGAAAAFASLERALRTAGRARPPQTTPSEYLRVIADDRALGPDIAAAAESVVRAFERERFSTSPPGPAEVDRAKEAALRVRELLRAR